VLNDTRCIIQLQEKTSFADYSIAYSFEFDLERSRIVTGPDAFRIPPSTFRRDFQVKMPSVVVRDVDTIWFMQIPDHLDWVTLHRGARDGHKQEKERLRATRCRHRQGNPGVAIALPTHAVPMVQEQVCTDACEAMGDRVTACAFQPSGQGALSNSCVYYTSSIDELDVIPVAEYNDVCVIYRRCAAMPHASACRSVEQCAWSWRQNKCVDAIKPIVREPLNRGINCARATDFHTCEDNAGACRWVPSLHQCVKNEKIHHMHEASSTVHGHKVILWEINHAYEFDLSLSFAQKNNSELHSAEAERNGTDIPPEEKVFSSSSSSSSYMMEPDEWSSDAQDAEDHDELPTDLNMEELSNDFLELPPLWPINYSLEEHGVGITFHENHIIFRLKNNDKIPHEHTPELDVLLPAGTVLACEKKQWVERAPCFKGSFQRSAEDAFKNSVPERGSSCRRPWSDICTVLFKPNGKTTVIGFAITRSRVYIQILDNVRARLISWKHRRDSEQLPEESPDSTFWHMDRVLGESIVGTYALKPVEGKKNDDLWIIKKEFLRKTFHLFEGKNIDVCASRIHDNEDDDSSQRSACEQKSEDIECVYIAHARSCEGTAGPVLREKRVLNDELARNIKIEQKWAHSADGTQIPYYLIRDERTQLPVRTLLHGYGAFGIKALPTFLPTISVGWLKHGYAYAIANLRGGSELGFPWWRAAVRESKGKTYEDFIAVSEDLTNNGITTPSRLAIHGRSAGGLMMAYMLVKHPEMFGAILSDNPITNVQKDVDGHGDNYDYKVTDDLGRSSDYRSNPGLYMNLSPLHMLEAGKRYPSILLSTGTYDDIAETFHSRQFKELLRKLGYQNSSWLYEDSDGTHGAGRREAGQGLCLGPFHKALQFEFLFQNLEE